MNRRSFFGSMVGMIAAGNVKPPTKPQTVTVTINSTVLLDALMDDLRRFGISRRFSLNKAAASVTDPE